VLALEIADDPLDFVGRAKAVAPCPASAVAIPSPIPLVEPATIAVLPARMPFPLKMSSLKPPKFSATQGVECERTPTLL
jgi:hypothetical protein